MPGESYFYVVNFKDHFTGSIFWAACLVRKYIDHISNPIVQQSSAAQYIVSHNKSPCMMLYNSIVRQLTEMDNKFIDWKTMVVVV